MKRKILACLLALTLITGLMLSGCADETETTGGETTPQSDTTDPGNAEQSPDESSDQSEELSETPADLSNPESVLVSFWESYTMLDFERAEVYISSQAQGEFDVFLDEVASNPYGLQVWQLAIKNTHLEVLGVEITDETAAVSVDVRTRDFGELENIPGGEEVIMDLLMLLIVSGFELVDTGADPDEYEFDEEEWNRIFDELELLVEQTSEIRQETEVMFVLEGGQWKINEVPMANFFDQ